MKSGMYLTKAEVFPLVAAGANTPGELIREISRTFACGIDYNVAVKIIEDFNNKG